MISLGCPKNRVDSEVMLGVLARRGFVPTSDPKTADVVIVNTCGFIEDAKRESIAAILDVAGDRGRRKTLVVAGCLAQRYGEELRREIPEIDVLVGLDELEKVAGLLKRGRTLDGGFPEPHYLYRSSTPRLLSGSTHSAYLKISDGCDWACSFCTLPAIRGTHRSRPLRDVIREAENLAARGVREVNLVAQDSAGYGRDLYGKPRIVELLGRLSKVEGLEWVRLHYLHPARLGEDLIRAIAMTPKVCPYFDVPLQHASDRILRSMKRVGNRDVLERMVRAIRRAAPDAALRSTFIVGYPGETEREFEELLGFLEDLKFDHAGFFAYSSEEGTAAAHLPDPLSDTVRMERLNRAYRLQEELAPVAHERWVGRRCRVVVEGFEGRKAWGRLDVQAPEVDGVSWVQGVSGIRSGTWLDVEVTGVLGQDLIVQGVSRK